MGDEENKPSEYAIAAQDTFDTHYQKYLDFTGDASFLEFIKDDMDLFVKHTLGNDVIDIGCGPGRDGLALKAKGLNPYCIDISPEMVRICKERGLNSQVMDMERLQTSRKFGGAWAYTSLLFVPKKRLPHIVKSIASILDTDGVLYVGLAQGNHDGWKEGGVYPGTKRWKAEYTMEEAKTYFTDHFEIIHTSTVRPFNKLSYVNLLLRKK